jgi:hypothetical protein
MHITPVQEEACNEFARLLLNAEHRDIVGIEKAFAQKYRTLPRIHYCFAVCNISNSGTPTCGTYPTRSWQLISKASNKRRQSSRNGNALKRTRRTQSKAISPFVSRNCDPFTACERAPARQNPIFLIQLPVAPL